MNADRLKNATVAKYFDVDKLSADLMSWDLNVQPLHPEKPGSHVASIAQINGGKFLYDFASFLITLDHRGATPPDMYTFSVPQISAGPFWHRGRSYGSNYIFVQQPGTEFHVITPKGFEIFHISLPEADVHRRLHSYGLGQARFQKLPKAFHAPAQLMQDARSILAKSCWEEGFAKDWIADDLVDRIVECWLAQEGLTPRRETLTIPKAALEQCLEAVSAGDTVGLDVSRICASTGVSRRALERAFSEMLGLGPSTFFKVARLAEARRRLINPPDENQTVANAMFETGFSHVGQFARDYRKMFGELPSDTLKRVTGA